MYRIQTRLLGRDRLTAALAPVVERTVGGRATGTVIDLGGGIAPYRDLWPESWTYYSVDPDERPAQIGSASTRVVHLAGTAASVPLEAGVADMVFMSSMSHHLDDPVWSASLAEAERLCRPGGSFLFVDGVWNPSRRISRLGWFVDGGRHPRSAHDLESAIAGTFSIEAVERLTLLHDVLIVVATSNPQEVQG